MKTKTANFQKISATKTRSIQDTVMSNVESLAEIHRVITANLTVTAPQQPLSTVADSFQLR